MRIESGSQANGHREILPAQISPVRGAAPPSPAMEAIASPIIGAGVKLESEAYRTPRRSIAGDSLLRREAHSSSESRDTKSLTRVSISKFGLQNG